MHVLTMNYVSLAMRTLYEEAREAEVELDPKIDHLCVAKMIGEVHTQGGKVRFLP
jgi:hypothetical protein